MVAMPAVAGALVGHVLAGPGDVAGAAVAIQATRDVPPAYLALYQQAATTCRGMRWQLLAAVGRIESDHGRARAVGVTAGENPWGAAGPMQFLQATWKQWGTANVADRYDPAFAVPAAARFLCALGAGTNEAHAASSYYAGPYATGKGRAQGDAYAVDVERQADAYAGGTTGPNGPVVPNGPKVTVPTTTAPSTRPPTAVTSPPKPSGRRGPLSNKISGHIVRAAG